MILTRILTSLVLLVIAQVSTAYAQTTVAGTIRHGGTVRDYRLYVPAAYRAGTQVPLLLNLHGYGSNSLQQEQYGDFRSIADTANFLVLHPNGLADGSGSRSWNTFLPPGSGGPDDVSFLSALIDSVRLRYNVDTDRIYSTGMSNGGFMSYELACRLSSRIAAIASVTGSITVGRLSACMPQHPTPVLQIHGTADNTVPYNGSSFFESVPTVLNYWVQFNNCNPVPIVTAVPDLNTMDGCTAERSVWTGGRAGSVVEHYRIINGGHTWPGAPVNIGTTNRDINASREIWRFLRGYRLSRLALATTPTPEILAVVIYPNPVTNVLTIKLGTGQRPARLAVTDMLGRTIPVQPLVSSDGSIKLNTASWTAGVYSLRVEVDSRTTFHQIVKAQE